MDNQKKSPFTAFSVHTCLLLGEHVSVVLRVVGSSRALSDTRASHILSLSLPEGGIFKYSPGMALLSDEERYRKRRQAIVYVLQGELWQHVLKTKPTGVRVPSHLHPPDPADEGLSKRGWEKAMAAWRRHIRRTASSGWRSTD